MSIIFYGAPFSSASPVACALAELEVPHERVVMNLAAGDTRKPEFMRLNPNGKVPTLVVDGTPMFEALAILLWLGERYGSERALWPLPGDPARLQALSWCTWSYVTFGSALVRYQFATNARVDPALHNEAAGKHALGEIRQLLDMLETRLTAQSHMLGAAYSLVDLVVASVLGYGAFVGAPVNEYPHVKAWLERCQARPSFKSVMQQ
jgi:GST-like protein